MTAIHISDSLYKNFEICVYVNDCGQERGTFEVRIQYPNGEYNWIYSAYGLLTHESAIAVGCAWVDGRTNSALLQNSEITAL